jgi:hypothetical protein
MDNITEIRKGLDLLFEPGDVVELRVPRKHEVEYSSTTSGFFDDLDRLAEAIDYINTKKKQTVYVTMNPLKRDWQGVNNQAYIGSATLREELQLSQQPLEPRMKKSIAWESGKTHYSMRMSEDEDISLRRWILIDIDAGQPAGTNSSDQEHRDTLDMAMEIRAYLTSRGFPKTALTNSGNGHHIYVRIDLPNTTENLLLVKRFLKSINQNFRGQFGTAMVDEGMFNAARITKAAGTHVYKGPHTDDRPNRQSKVLHFASKTPTTETQITEIANEYISVAGEFDHFNPNDEVIDDKEIREKVDKLKSYLDYYDVNYQSIRQNGDDVIIPCTCPNASEHTMDGGELEAVAMVAATGAYSFRCQHAHCSDLHNWRGFRNFIESRSNKPVFVWDDRVLLLNGKQIAGPKQSQSTQPIIFNPKPTKEQKAIELLTKLCNPVCPPHIAKDIAKDQGISERTLQRAYAPANVFYVQGKNDCWLEQRSSQDETNMRTIY